MVSTTQLSPWVEKAKALEPEVTKWRDVGERERRLPAELFDAIKRAGLLRLALPRAFGGEQMDLRTIVEVIEEASRQDGSTGWNLMISVLGGGFADYLSEDAAREMFATGDEVAVGSFAPNGQAIPVDGGFKVNGHWSFGSGCQNANWLSGGFLVMEDGKPRMNADGIPDVQVLFFRTSEAEILDTWHTAGMRGTGSHDYQVADVFVPRDRGFPFFAFFRGPQARPSRGFAFPFLPNMVAPAMTAVALGIARDAIDSFKHLALGKTPAAATTPLGQQHSIHLRLGEAEALLRSARAYTYETVDRVQTALDAPPEALEEVAAAVRLASAHAVQSAIQAVDLMFEAAGGSSVYASSRIERCFRDVHMVSHHFIVAPSNIEMVGQYLLGGGLAMRR